MWVSVVENPMVSADLFRDVKTLAVGERDSDEW